MTIIEIPYSKFSLFDCNHAEAFDDCAFIICNHTEIFHECVSIMCKHMEGKSGQKEHFLILINHFLILMNIYLLYTMLILRI